MNKTFTRVKRRMLGYDVQRVDQFLARAKRSYAALASENPGLAEGSELAEGSGLLETPVPSDRSMLSESSVRSERLASSGEVREMIDAASVANVAFPMVRGGYLPAAVDAALDRLQTAFIHRQRAAVLAQSGENVWLDSTYELARKLYPRLRRSRRARFADAQGVGYSKAAVDRFLDRVSAYFAGKSELTVSDVRMVAFPSAKKNDAYNEAVVDVYLDELAKVLLAVE
ncbi:MAG: DivIVA domain-containing protein [Actinomycetaceae bacterium]|nr:DivIVA domain-containing protein [Actinomycetaceae bacterium]MDY5854847.1 DivIVA domain-containing protein [Arcanobacterium sp.]